MQFLEYILKTPPLFFFFTKHNRFESNGRLDARILSTRITILVNRCSRPTCGREHMAIISLPSPPLPLILDPTLLSHCTRLRGICRYIPSPPLSLFSISISKPRPLFQRNIYLQFSFRSNFNLVFSFYYSRASSYPSLYFLYIPSYIIYVTQ